MSDSPDDAIGTRLGDLARRVARRGRHSASRRLDQTRWALERRQLLQDQERFWVRLGKTAFRLAEDGEIGHPLIDKAVARIRELEQQIAELDARRPDSVVSSEHTDEHTPLATTQTAD